MHLQTRVGLIALGGLFACSGQIQPVDAQDLSAVSLSISPAARRVDAQYGAQPAPTSFQLHNAGSKRAAFSVLCSDDANAAPGLGVIDPGATVTVEVSTPGWWGWGQGLHAAACYAHGQGSSKEPIYTVLANVTSDADGGGSWDAGSSDGGGSWDAGSWDAGSSDGGGSRDAGR